MTPLFTAAGTGIAGEKYENVQNGFYQGELVRFEEGPTFPANDQGPERPMTRWFWKLYMQDGVTPLIIDGAQVEIDDMTSTKTGRNSTAQKWFNAHFKRAADTPIGSPEAAMEEAIGKRVNLAVTRKQNGYLKVDVFAL